MDLWCVGEMSDIDEVRSLFVVLKNVLKEDFVLGKMFLFIDFWMGVILVVLYYNVW